MFREYRSSLEKHKEVGLDKLTILRKKYGSRPEGRPLELERLQPGSERRCASAKGQIDIKERRRGRGIWPYVG